MKKSERTFAQRAIHSLQVSRSSLTEADVLKNSRTNTTWINQENHSNHLASDMSSTPETAGHVSWKVVIFMGKIKMRKTESITIREGSEKFYKWCRVNNYSDYTTNFYKKAIYNFSLFYDLDNPVSDINRDLMEDYALHLFSDSAFWCSILGARFWCAPHFCFLRFWV